MKAIRLTQGKFALVDDADFARVSGIKWAYHKDGYAVCCRRSGTIYMHHIVMRTTHRIDHENGDGLDNRRSNLRIATHQQNLCNQRLNKRNSSGFKGVSLHETKKWVAQIAYKGRRLYLGLYDDPIVAACVYDAASTELHGRFGRPNMKLQSIGRSR